MEAPRQSKWERCAASTAPATSANALEKPRESLLLNTKEQKQQEVGTIVTIEKDSFGILTGEGILVVKELQLEGKRRMTVEEFLRGASLELGTLLGR